MTLVLALPATDGVALVSDTRKWFRTGGYVDGHRKLFSSRDGLVTGTGSGQLLDDVVRRSGEQTFAGVIALITQVAKCGVWEFEIADWTLTTEHRPVCGGVQGGHGVGIVVFDGFAFKRTPWEAGSVPAGLPAQFVQRAHAQLHPIFAGGVTLREVRTIAFDVYTDLYRSGLLSREFDFGTHRPGKRVSIERLCAPTRLLHCPHEGSGSGSHGCNPWGGCRGR
jgi:hypothetical protein